MAGARVGRRILGQPLALAGAVIVLALVLVAALAPLIAGADPMAQALSARLLPPSGEHWLGTDALGRDVWARIAYGARITLGIVALVLVLTVPAGLFIGILAGYCGGWTDRIIARVIDIFLAFPRLVLALAFVAALGPGIDNAVIAIALTAWPPYARLARAETLLVRRADWLAAVRLAGASHARVLVRHVAPMCTASAVVRATLDMAGIILTAAGLGFLGLGAQPPTPEWGAMIAEGRQYLVDQWWVATIPGLAIFIVALGFNLLGDGLRDALDPRA